MTQDFDTPYRGGLVGRKHPFALTVYFEDTDTAQIDYHANYLKFMERARTDMLRAMGVDHAAAHHAGEGAYAVADLRIRYLRSARIGDDLLVVSSLASLGAASVVIHQEVRRGAELLAEADVTAAFLTPEGRPRRQPKDWIEKFKLMVEE